MQHKRFAPARRGKVVPQHIGLTRENERWHLLQTARRTRERLEIRPFGLLKRLVLEVLIDA